MGAACVIPDITVQMAAAAIKMTVRYDMELPLAVCQPMEVKLHAKAITDQNCSPAPLPMRTTNCSKLLRTKTI
jgi:hypothetical protein